MKGGTTPRRRASTRRRLGASLSISIVGLLVLLAVDRQARSVWMAPCQDVSARTAYSAAPRAQGPVAPSRRRTESRLEPKLRLIVEDENGVAVLAARVYLESADGKMSLKSETNYLGRSEFAEVLAGHYRLRVEKEGFFAFIEKEVAIGEVESIHVTLNHQPEFIERVNVTYSPPAIDPMKTQSSSNLDSREITDIPYAVTRDIRYALPYLPGVVRDGTAQLHVAGSETRQTLDLLDGFNMDSPVNGLFTMRVNVDAIRSVEVESSRYSVEFGKGSGGIVNLTTGMGDDHFRFSATDFTPSFQKRKGFHVNSWTPRATFSGPLRKGRAWFLLAPDGEYDLDLIPELPPGADRRYTWRGSNLAKAQVNLTRSNILTGSFLVNRLETRHAGLTRFAPLDTTVNLNQSASFFSLKDQAFLPHGLLLELGVASSHFHSAVEPRGNLPYVINPGGASGNFFETARGQSSRLQGIANLYFPSFQWNGPHELKVGIDLDRLTDRQSYLRNPFSILRQDGTVSRLAIFSPPSAAVTQDNFQAGAYAQDRWSVSERWLLEAGLRFDWDDIVQTLEVAPRWAVSYLAKRDGNTQLVAGLGWYYDRPNLDFITRPMAGQRADFFYDATGQALLRPPAQTVFDVNRADLKGPRFLNWSVGIEQKLPGSIYLKGNFLQKRGHNGWAFVNRFSGPGSGLSGPYVLGTTRSDHYDAMEITARKTFGTGHYVFASYTRSSARSNAVMNFTLENPVFGPQAGGPLPWDSPNRFISWGMLPLAKRLNLAYTLDLRDGFPFSLVNQDENLVGAPGSRRFPAYFSLNVAIERRFTVLGLQWALRGGFNDITNRHNPSVVDNNVDSPHFLAFGGEESRALTGRIRFLGRK